MQAYGKLYDIVQNNLQTAGKSFGYDKETFLADVGSHPQIVDVSNYLALSNPQFFQAVYVAAYKRLPEEKELQKWQGNYGMAKKKFQKLVLLEIVNSSVVAINHIRFINNPYFKQRMGIRYHVLGKLYGLTDKSSLREFGKKLPMPVQRVIRKVFL